MNSQQIRAWKKDETAKLFRNGKPIWGEDTHNKKLAQIKKNVGYFLEDAETTANEDMTAAQSRLDGLEAKRANPYGWLSGSETTRAAALAAFVKEDFNALTDIETVAALQTVQASGDKVLSWLAVRYAKAASPPIDGQSRAGEIITLLNDITEKIEPPTLAESIKKAGVVYADARSELAALEQLQPGYAARKASVLGVSEAAYQSVLDGQN